MKVKICGITRIDEIHHLNKLKPDYIGFVFAESKRRVSKEQVTKLIKFVDKNIKVVGVFRNNNREFIEEIIKDIPLYAIQLHGSESKEFINYFKENYSCHVWKGVSIEKEEDLIEALNLPVSALILDGKKPGSGRVFPWHYLDKVEVKKKILLAGGINEGNIQEALKIDCIEGIDISSGVESMVKGVRKKDPIKMKKIIEKVRENKMKGKFNDFGGQYVPETLMNALIELEDSFYKAIDDQDFIKEYKYYLKDYVGRESPLYFADNVTRDLGGAKVYLKREDCNHTGAHKINNAIGQILLAKRMGKKKVIAETGAGQHGVATATVAAKFKMDCKIFMGEEDIKRQALNVKKMELLGAEVVPVKSGNRTLKDAVNEAIRYWVSNVEDTYYVMGTVAGPHPYPIMVREFQKIIGHEAKKQILEKEGILPEVLIAPVGGGSNAMGLFYEFIEDKSVRLIGVEGAGEGLETGNHAAAFASKEKGILHGMMSYVLKDEDGQIKEAYSISAGLDYPSVGPEHAYLSEINRAEYVSVTDKEAVDAFLYLTKQEGIVPALESSHAVAYARKIVPTLPKDSIVIINISGRGDKDMDAILKYMEEHDYE